MNNYCQIRASIDPKIIGKSEVPLTVEIKNKYFSEQSRKYTLDVNTYFEEQLKLYDNFPKNLEGKMYQKNRNPIDVMNVSPFYMSLQFAVSEKVVDIFYNLAVNKAEYHLEKFTVEGSNDNFYFLFIPLLKSEDHIDFSQSIFIDDVSEKEVVFESYVAYKEKSKNNYYRAKLLSVSGELQRRDLISLQKGKPFYSKRLIDAFQQENIIGYEIIKSGDSKVDLHFI